MKPESKHFPTTLLFCLLSLFLIGAGISRWIETDSGKILVHDISVESYEGFFYGARLFRPLQASSLNQRPAILLIFGDTADRYTGDHIAQELARRGFVALTMEDFGQGATETSPDYETENLVDAGYSFLVSRSFTDHSRIGLAAFYTGAEKALESKSLSEFSSSIFVSPPSACQADIPSDIRILSAAYETDPDFILSADDGMNFELISAYHSGMVFSSEVISEMLEQFHEDLAIPNDMPLWFDSAEQSAQILLGIRGLLLILLFVICAGLSAFMTVKLSNIIVKTAARIVIPLGLFLLIEEIMNFFLISVRLGSPFHYLPTLIQAVNHFSAPLLGCVLIAVLIWNIPLGRSFFVSDLFAAIGIIICLAAFLPLCLSGSEGLLLAKLKDLKWILLPAVFYSSIDSILIRMAGANRTARFCITAVTCVMFYFACCGLQAVWHF